MNPTELYDINDFWLEPFWQTVWFRWTVVGGGFVALLLVGIMLWRFFFLKKRKRLLWQVALDDLMVLRSLPLDDGETQSRVYVAMTRILKDYMTQRYGWDVRGLTDSEVVLFLQEKRVDPRIAKAFETVASGCVRVKFAQESSRREQVLTDLALSEDIIRATIPSHDA